jgi:hypothetical protein
MKPGPHPGTAALADKGGGIRTFAASGTIVEPQHEKG